ncbi:MAG: hypothetical protein KJ066_19530 [Acidobacteria bacterium]|nr:hypothetical protein [Acidobacteriota bacterium]
MAKGLVAAGMADVEFTTASLMAALSRVGEEITVEIVPLVAQAAATHEATVRARYPVGPTGHLQRWITRYQRHRLSWGVRAHAPHVHLFEQGTDARYTSTSRAHRGRMPAAGPIFVTSAVAARAAMLRAAQSVLERHREV